MKTLNRDLFGTKKHWKKTDEEKPKPISPSTFGKRMRKIMREFADDPEVKHIKADDLMCEMLEELGYEEGARVFRRASKLYA